MSCFQLAQGGFALGHGSRGVTACVLLLCCFVGWAGVARADPPPTPTGPPRALIEVEAGEVEAGEVDAAAIDAAEVDAEEVAAGQSASRDTTPAERERVDIQRVEVERVDVDLSIRRSGQIHPTTGRKIRRHEAVVDGVALYQLAVPDDADPETRPSPELGAGEAQRELWLLDYPTAVRSEPTDIDEVQLARLTDGPWRESSMTLLDVHTPDGQQLAVERSPLGWRVRVPEGVTRVEVDYRVDVPRRYWPFGCDAERCALAGGVAPLPAAPARGGAWLPAGGQVIAPAQWSVNARFVTAAEDPVRAAERRLAVETLGTSSRTQRRVERGQIVVADRGLRPGDPIAYPMVVWGRFEQIEAEHRGVHVDVVYPWFRPPDTAPFERPAQLHRDVPGRALELAKEAIDAGLRRGIEFPPAGRLLIVVGPLRVALAESHPTAVLVSSEAWEVFPAERFLELHDVAVARAFFDTMARAYLTPHLDPSIGVWGPSMLGVALTQVWERERHMRDTYARDLLRAVTFVPAVDAFLYSGQGAFASAYFRGVDDDLGPRRHPLWFSHRLPSGRRVHEELADLVPDDVLTRYYEAWLAAPWRTPRSVIEEVWGRDMGWFFEQWVGPAPDVDYRVRDVKSVRHGDRFHHRIVVERDAARPIVEAVQVLVTERGGRRHYLVWNGEAVPGEAIDLQPSQARHVFTLETARPIKSVLLDPRDRTVQRARFAAKPGRRRGNVDPRFDDRTPAKLRFLYSGFGFDVAASELSRATTPTARWNAISGFAAFEAGLQRDLRRTGTLIVAKDREAHLTLAGGLNSYFGGKRNPQYRRWRLRASVSGSWLTDRSLDPRDGVRLLEMLTLSHDTRRFAWWPERGHRIYGSVQASQVVRFDEDRTDDRFGLNTYVGWEQMWRLAKDHVLATRLEWSIAMPIASRPEYRSLLRVGGVAGLSGYLADEIFTRQMLLMQAEYRHVWINDLHVNALHVGWLRSLGGVAFAGAATFSRCEDFGGGFTREQWAAQVGYGVQAYVQVLGMVPQLVRLDVAVPLVRRDRTCLGNVLPDYLAEVQGLDPKLGRALLPPVAVSLVFNHPF